MTSFLRRLSVTDSVTRALTAELAARVGTAGVAPGRWGSALLSGDRSREASVAHAALRCVREGLIPRSLSSRAERGILLGNGSTVAKKIPRSARDEVPVPPGTYSPAPNPFCK